MTGVMLNDAVPLVSHKATDASAVSVLVNNDAVPLVSHKATDASAVSVLVNNNIVPFVSGKLLTPVLFLFLLIIT